jgi:hypothetical protein
LDGREVYRKGGKFASDRIKYTGANRSLWDESANATVDMNADNFPPRGRVVAFGLFITIFAVSHDCDRLTLREIQ